ncbi:hypothetical protein QJS66_15375 [Kocuria rhizophila]|nr:hypothetical protein QJS66_15375 [Kocuria rhizophila]
MPVENANECRAPSRAARRRLGVGAGQVDRAGARTAPPALVGCRRRGRGVDRGHHGAQGDVCAARGWCEW